MSHISRMCVFCALVFSFACKAPLFGGALAASLFFFKKKYAFFWGRGGLAVILFFLAIAMQYLLFNQVQIICY